MEWNDPEIELLDRQLHTLTARPTVDYNKVHPSLVKPF